MSIHLRREPTDEETEAICTAAEEAARKFLLSKIPLRRLEDLHLIVEALGGKPLSLSIEVAVEASQDDPDLESAVDEATDVAFLAAEAKAQELDLCKVSNE